jgi:two-component system, sporulation sensor kinase E
MYKSIKIVFAALMIALVSTILYLFMFNTGDHEDNSVILHNWDYRMGAAPSDSTAFAEWRNQADDDQGWKSIEFPNNPKDRGSQNEMWLRTTLPYGEFPDPSLSVQVFEHYQIYSGERLIYSFGSLDPLQRTKYPGTPLRIVKIPNDALGKPLYLHVYSQSKNMGIVSDAKLGTRADFNLQILHSGTERLIFGFLYMVSGLIFLVISTNLSKQWVFTSFSAFLLFYGLYSICLTKVIYLFYDAPIFWTFTELITLYLWVGAMLSFIEQMFGAGYMQVIRRLWQFTCICAVVFLSGIGFNLITIPQAVIFYLLFIAISIVIVLVHIAHKAWTGNREAGVVLIGLAIVSATGLMDIFKYMFRMTSSLPSFTHLSILLFICILIYLMVKRLSIMIELMKKTEKMAVVGQMAASVAHEIRNPMTVISGFLQLMKKDIQNPMHLLAIMSEINRINEMINNFLLFSNPSQVQFVKHSIKDLLDETILLFQPLLNERMVRIIFEYQESLPPTIECDPNKIKQVLMNLIKNAIESMDTHGNIHISLSFDSHNTVQIRISDQGIGISPEHLKQIWEPFFTTKQCGTGLGLMVSLKIIELHQGTISVQSKKQEGTSFLIELPASHVLLA